MAGLQISDALLGLEDSSLDVSFRLRVQPFQELGLQAGRHLDHADPGSGGRPFFLDDRAERLDVPVGLRAVLGAELHRDPNLLEANWDERPEGVEDLLHLLLDALERVDVDLRLLHRVLDPLRRMGRPRLGVDRIRGDVLHNLFALRLQHLATLLGRQLNLSASTTGLTSIARASTCAPAAAFWRPCRPRIIAPSWAMFSLYFSSRSSMTAWRPWPMLPALYDTRAPLGSVSNRWVPRSSTPATRSAVPNGRTPPYWV